MKNRLRGYVVLVVLGVVLAGCSVLRGPAVKPADEDLPLINPGFEEMDPDNPQQALGWSSFAGVVWGSNVVVDDSNVYSGQKALAIHTADPPSNTGLRSSKVPGIPGRLYRASAMAYLDSDTGQASIYVEFFDENGQRITANWEATSTRREWHRIEVTDRAPEGTVYVGVILYRTSSARGTHYFDDVRLTLLGE